MGSTNSEISNSEIFPRSEQCYLYVKIIHAFVSSLLDCCNALFTCLSARDVAELQTVQNSAARHIAVLNPRGPTGTSCCFRGAVKSTLKLITAVFL